MLINDLVEGRVSDLFAVMWLDTTQAPPGNRWSRLAQLALLQSYENAVWRDMLVERRVAAKLMFRPRQDTLI